MARMTSASTTGISPIFVKKPNDSRPHMYVKILNNSVLALLDTGSNATIFGSSGVDLLRKLNIPIQHDQNLHVTTADGKVQEVLGYVAQAIRLAKHDVTGYSPAFLTFGRNIPLTGDYYGQVSENANNVVTISEKNQLIEDLQELPKFHEDIRTKLKDAYIRNANQYNLRKRNLSFKIGDRVWKRNYTLSSKANDYSAKLSAKYIPCVVVKVMSNLVYKLKDTNGVDLGNWHVKDLKPDHRNLDSDDESGPASSSDSDNHDI
ncbi:hypothetical protein NQ317_001936 [Molorchus minor]|uniref:Peptidase A2 domain-containing protein n=1 Tax=Molorchus minor TaxID=1323400 RepID=A0ABQ9IZM9_9CUCU|nr:hypothetical protein NQ317_001936 [Molorchus minor]